MNNREAFEAWFNETYFEHNLNRDEQGDYISTTPRLIWQAWQAALASQAQQTESQWISVEERLPEVRKNDYKNVLIALIAHHNGKRYVYEASYLNEKLFTDYEGDADDDEEKAFSGWHKEVERDGDDYFDPITHGTVTHWMDKPLPPAPEGDKT